MLLLASFTTTTSLGRLLVLQLLALQNSSQDVMVDPVRGPVKIQSQSPVNKVMMRPADQVRQADAGAACWASDDLCTFKQIGDAAAPLREHLA
jgi:hypothetical protein